ncbi:LysM peptidoglycan-binding domain-containing protein [Chloroflexota bacterium]
MDRVECPICQTISTALLTACPICGAQLTNAPLLAATVVQPRPHQPGSASNVGFDPGLGEDDLYAPGLLRFPWWGIVIPLLLGCLAMVVCGLLAGVAFSRGLGFQWGQPASQGVQATPVPTFGLPGGPTPALGGTAYPTLDLQPVTVTPTPPPSATPTATPGPCEQMVNPGDTLISLAIACGHQDLAVLDEIIQLNGLRSAESVQLGQTVLIPWPTPTLSIPDNGEDGAAVAPDVEGSVIEDPETTGGDAEVTAISVVIPSPTLQPGVMWYTVQPGDNILSIAVQFQANIEIMAQLNPEVTFSQCDFGMDSGGGNCIVQLYQGQAIRVPAPTPTPTLSPTPSGSETPTPTPTPTFNAPSLLSPGNLFLFGPDDIVTLRWVTTGVLAEGDIYRLTVNDTTLGEVYTATTSETVFILPGEWQPDDGARHMFTWDVAVGPSDGMDNLTSVTFNTPAQMFYWDSP